MTTCATIILFLIAFTAGFIAGMRVSRWCLRKQQLERSAFLGVNRRLILED